MVEGKPRRQLNRDRVIMEGKCIKKFVRLSPQKCRRLADLIKGQNATDAIAILEQMPNRAALPLRKAIKSAVSNVISQAGELKIKEENLFLKTVRIDAASSKYLKRLRPRAMGRADVIKHRTSHIFVVVSDKTEMEE